MDVFYEFLLDLVIDLLDNLVLLIDSSNHLFSNFLELGNLFGDLQEDLVYEFDSLVRVNLSLFFEDDLCYLLGFIYHDINNLCLHGNDLGDVSLFS